MGRGRKSMNRGNGEDSQNSAGSQSNLDNVRVSIGNPFMSTDLNKYVQNASSTAPISKENRSNKNAQKTPLSMIDNKRAPGNAYIQSNYRVKQSGHKQSL